MIGVVVVGSVNLDMVVTLDRLPRPGETATGGRFARHFGGKGANQAVAAARMGAGTALLARVGADAMGEEALADLRAEGVLVEGIGRDADAPTGVALIAVDGAGANQIAVASGANAALSAGAVARGLASLPLAPGAVCVLGFEVPDAPLLAAAEGARARGLRLLVNPAPPRPIPAALLGPDSLLVPNEGEALALEPASDALAAAETLARRTGTPVLVTLGAAGAALLHPGRPALRVPALPVRVVDTTGAGDTFLGALAAGLAAGEAPETAMRRAAAAASLSVAWAGARAGMPRGAQVAQALAEAGAAP